MLWYVAAALIVLLVLRQAQLRLMLSRAKHRSLSGHARLSRLVTRLIPYYEYDETRFFCADDAPAEVAARRREAFMRLAALYAQRYARSAALTREVAPAVSDLQFTARYRVPFQFSRMVRQHLQGRRFPRSPPRAPPSPTWTAIAATISAARTG